MNKSYRYAIFYAAGLSFYGVMQEAYGLTIFFALLTVLFWRKQRWAYWLGTFACLFMIVATVVRHLASDAELAHFEVSKPSLFLTLRESAMFLIVAITYVSILKSSRAMRMSEGLEKPTISS